MEIVISKVGAGTVSDPYHPDINNDLLASWTENNDGTATVTLTDEATRTAKSDATTAAIALNGVNTWAHIQDRFGDEPLFPAVQKWLAAGTESEDAVKKAWSKFSGSVPQGFVVSHDAALWRATVETTAEPSTTSDDWTLIFSL